jgi:hypothetical protein
MNRFNMRSQFDSRDDLLYELTKHRFLGAPRSHLTRARSHFGPESDILAGRAMETTLGAAKTAAAGS